MKPKVAILRTDGTNCDRETYYAFAKAGGECQYVHINELREKSKKLPDYQILALPGGFSYGDDVHSGKILAVELTSFLKEQLQEFVEAKKPILGICNGFQILVRTGLLPEQKIGKISCTLMDNDSGHFECRWVNLLVEDSPCIFTKNMVGQVIKIQVAHGEGKFYTEDKILQRIEDNRQVAFRYCDDKGIPTKEYPFNPNASIKAIAGICDKTGLIMGMMPHPERYVEKTQYPNWRREKDMAPQGLPIFLNAIEYVKQS